MGFQSKLDSEKTIAKIFYSTLMVALLPKHWSHARMQQTKRFRKTLDKILFYASSKKAKYQFLCFSFYV